MPSLTIQKIITALPPVTCLMQGVLRKQRAMFFHRKNFHSRDGIFVPYHGISVTRGGAQSFNGPVSAHFVFLYFQRVQDSRQIDHTKRLAMVTDVLN
jgi:hypothetical protein